MHLFRKLTYHFKDNKASYLLLAFLIFLGFFAGCFYANLVSDTEFSVGHQQAKLFIESAKTNSLSFYLMLIEELSPYLLMAFFSLVLFGFLPTVFFVFKWGFSQGFFLTFLVKFFLIISLIFLLVPLLVIAKKSLAFSFFLFSSVLHKSSLKRTLSQELVGMSVVVLAAGIFVTLGVFIKFLLLPPLLGYLFL